MKTRTTLYDLLGLPPTATAADYARSILDLASSPERYAHLARRSFTEFQERLNWRAWMARFVPQLEAALAATRAA